jgi:hypothetical protein
VDLEGTKKQHIFQPCLDTLVSLPPPMTEAIADPPAEPCHLPVIACSATTKFSNFNRLTLIFFDPRARRRLPLIQQGPDCLS